MTLTPSATGPSDPHSPCAYCQAHSVGTPLADELVCVCETPCAAARCSAREEWKDCAGRCGKHVPKNRTACRDCWGLLPYGMREAVKIRRGAMRAAVIAQAREWYEQNVSEGRLISPAPEPQRTLVERGEPMPTPAPTHTAPANDLQPDTGAPDRT